jgi:hypothetical protein
VHRFDRLGVRRSGAGLRAVAARRDHPLRLRKEIPVAALTTILQNDVGTDPPGKITGYVGKPMTSGVRVYRVSYRTLPLAGLGYVVLTPDLAGYANFGAPGNPPSAYGDTQDVGKSTLDGARARCKT